jgi:predicted nucleic acid-binding protein
MIFVDSGACFARHVPSDPLHAIVHAWFASNDEPLLTTDYCIDETLTLLVARGRPALAMDAGRAFFHDHVAAVHFVTPSQVHRAWILFQQRATAGWSFTDCTSKIVIDELGIRAAVALDDHFRQFGNVAVVP